ncbi:predicted protein [Aspergillus nidulans FGSC A4]|uniref:Uncharacterized protein n=1 Tax=Emericella nidulans (strain FGSC A4 / ATCC 38163 / CBS 112.46 / NRRL 194 / M139) TaxID=227321 RepID=Q5BCQ8_EMENI|nr:hypothetical protein [Aspergillus nidulans FGSC A4]EAA64792.1 predicted protein [Aspergillus nidulans FGSC A4]CBF85340.1 TPA: hypothetical protein ANIA_01672 [Aspergillus nidulans FGSC A4]|eukprot:XP_659276.1 predicted protein [Aspergillus nidulans FGSC A4]
MTTLSNMLWSENRLYSASQNTAFLSALMAYQTLIESDNKASLFIHTVNDHAFVTFTYSGPVKDGCPAIFMPFQRIPYMRYLVPPARRTVLEMAKGVADVLESEKLCIASEVYQAAEQARLDAVASLADLNRADLTMVIQPMSPLSVKAANDSGGNSFSLNCAGHQIIRIDMGLLTLYYYEYNPEGVFQVLQNGG